MRHVISILALSLVALAGCETYEFPPRLIGVGTEDCSQCEELVLSEMRIPAGALDISARFAFEDDWGAISKVQVFVTTPSGVVIEEPYEVDVEGEVETRYRPGFTCIYVTELAEDVGALTCQVTAAHANAINTFDVGRRLAGYQAGELSARFGLEATEFGEYSVEVVATRSNGMASNRLSSTFEVIEDVVSDTDGGRVDPETTGAGTE